MKIITLFLPGDFEDAYLYMGRLVVLTAEGTLCEYNLEQIVSQLEEWFPTSKPLLTWLFARNDWLANAQFVSLAKNREFVEVFLSAFKGFPSECPIELNGASAPIVSEHVLHIPALVLLDMLIYNQRLYISANTGLYHFDIEWGRDAIHMPKQPAKRHDARCISTSAKYGSISTSCGDDGLFNAIDDFGWANSGVHDGEMRQIAQKSLRTAWSGYNLINYTTSTTPVLLQSSRQKIRGKGFEREGTLVTEIGKEQVELSYLLDDIRPKAGVTLESIQYVYNTSNTLFVHTAEGFFYSIGIRQSENAPPEASYMKAYEGPSTRILSIHPSRVGLIIETEDKVLLFSHKVWFAIINSEVLSVRTFTRSRRYQNILATTSEDGVFISSLFDDEELHQRVSP